MKRLLLCAVALVAANGLLPLRPKISAGHGLKTERSNRCLQQVAVTPSMLFVNVGDRVSQRSLDCLCRFRNVDVDIGSEAFLRPERQDKL
jgi:hypothetical protein